MVGAEGEGGHMSVGKDSGESMATGPQKRELAEKRNLENIQAESKLAKGVWQCSACNHERHHDAVSAAAMGTTI